MLVDPTFRHTEMAAAKSYCALYHHKIGPGLYIDESFNFSNWIDIPEPRFEHEYPEFDDSYHARIPCYPGEDAHGYLNSYGVCDSPDQFITLVGDLLKADVRSFVVSFTHVSKKCQSSEGGWRWHKWGPYIGTGRPTSEYLYDEDKFDDGVWAYNITQLDGPIIISELTKRLRGPKDTADSCKKES